MLNLDDRSTLISGAINYQTLHLLELELAFWSMGGEYPGEFNALGNRLGAQVVVAYPF